MSVPDLTSKLKACERFTASEREVFLFLRDAFPYKACVGKWQSMQRYIPWCLTTFGRDAYLEKDSNDYSYFKHRRWTCFWDRSQGHIFFRTEAEAVMFKLNFGVDVCKSIDRMP